MSEISDFVRRHLHGSDYVPDLPPEPKMHSFIPAYYAQAVLIEAVIDLAKAEGCTEREIEQLRQAFYAPREPVLVSIDDLSDEDEE